MTSKLEDVLLRCQRSNGKVRTTLFDHLNEGTSLHALRQCSRPLKDIIDHEATRLWHSLYIHAPLRPSDIVPTFESGAEFCRHLTISIGFDRTATNRRASRVKRASRMFKHFPGVQRLFASREKTARKTAVTDSLSAQSKTVQGTEDDAALYPFLTELPSKNHVTLERLIWQSIIKKLTNASTITIRTNGHPAWRGRDEPESTLLLLRMCLENARLPRLRHLNLHPIHGMGILHLRWGSFGAFSERPNLRALQFWQSITSLSLRLRNPAAQQDQIYGQQYITFLKIFNDYLRSFSRNLLSFRFVWLDREGPNPLALDLEPEMEKQTRVQWPVLEEYWLGNVDFPNRALATIAERAPGVNVVRVLRSTHRDANLDFASDGAWMVISQRRLDRMHDNHDAVSVYSQSEISSPRPFEQKFAMGSLHDVDEVEAYDPENYPPVDTAIRRGRKYPLIDRRMLATRSVYSESEARQSGYDPESVLWSLHDIDEDEAADPEQHSQISMGRGNPLVDRRMLATSSIYPESRARMSEWEIAMIPSTLGSMEGLRPAPLKVAAKQHAEVPTDNH